MYWLMNGLKKSTWVLSLAIFSLIFQSITSVYAGEELRQLMNKPSEGSLIKPENVAVIVNQSDDKSVEVGQYYLTARNIPAKNLIKVSLPKGLKAISVEEFEKFRKLVYAGLNDDIQVIVMVWTTPYSVDCNSITSAMTFGFDNTNCVCNPAKPNFKLNLYFDSASKKPLKDYGMRLSMLLPIESVRQAKELIDRGVLSSFKLNDGSAYLLRTDDVARSAPREQFFPPDLAKVPAKGLTIRNMKVNAIEHRDDVMFYFTGASTVPRLETLNFLPGAIADHLTSYGGDLLGTGQMSSMRWLIAGATASYGTVSEPCNYWQKFPNPAVLMKHYLTGETAIEAYWKSVAWIGQGIFIGEPLAAPYQATRVMPAIDSDAEAK